MICQVCKNTIERIDLLACSACLDTYHYGCANVTSAQWREQYISIKRNWKCPSCFKITLRKGGGTQRSPPPQINQTLENTNMSCDDVNISTIGDNTSIQPQYISPVPQSEDQNTITYDRFSQLIKSELEHLKNTMTQSITQEIKASLTQEITSTIKNITHELKESTERISIEQTNLKTEIAGLDKKILSLQNENAKLQSELNSLKTIQGPAKEYNDEYTDKKIVLYGLNEHDRFEQECDLIQRVSLVFHEITGVDINAFIENVSRIGSRGYRRPVVIELLSKRMTRYILQHTECFKNTGLYISQFLDDATLQKRNALRDILREARSKGQNAIIRRNKVYVGSKEYIPTSAQKTEISPKKSMSPEHPITSGDSVQSETASHRRGENTTNDNKKQPFR